MNSVECNSIDGIDSISDLKCLDELHKLHNDYPVAPEKLELSNCCSNIENEYGINIGGVNKLVPDLDNKSKYALQYRNLQSYLSLGIKLTTGYRILKFKQSDWLKKYIDFNANKRKKCSYSFVKNFFKLMNNIVFGKTMENSRKIISVRLVNNAEDYTKYTSKPSFVSQKIFNKNFVAIHEIKPVLTLNKPVYGEFRILDLSKYLMSEFHCKCIKSK